MKRFFIAIILSVLTTTQYANTIKGIVTDANQKPLLGANIYVSEIQRGTVTNQDGSFLLSGLPASGTVTLQVSFVGYHSQIEKVNLNYLSDFRFVLEESPIRSSELVVSAGKPSSQHHTAIRIDNLEAAQIERGGQFSLAEALSTVPGVDLIGKGPGISTPVIRGLSTSNILVLNDGFRLENYQFSDHHPYPLDENGLEKVEIVKGPASLLFGADAIGGVVNTLSEKPAAFGTYAADANVSYFSNTQGYATNFGVKQTNSLIYWGIRGGMKSHGDYYDGNGGRVSNSRFNQNVMKSFVGLSKSFGSFRLNYLLMQQKPGMTNEEIPLLNLSQSHKNEVWYQDLTNHLITSKNTLFLGTHHVQLDMAYQNNRRILMQEADEKLVDMRLQTLNYKVQDNISLGAKTDFIAGVQGMYQSSANGEAHQKILPNYSLNDFSVLTLVQHEYNKKVHMQAGLRVDTRSLAIPEQEKAGGHTHGEELIEEDDDHELFLALHRNFTNVSGSAGLTWHLAQNLNFRANLASAYRAPNVAELSQDGRHEVRYEQGDRNLKSQRNYEADISFHFHNNFVLLDVSGYYNFINQYIYLGKTADTTALGQSIYRYRQNDAAIYGLESYFEIMPVSKFNVNGSFSYIRAKQTNGVNLPFIPHNNLKVNLAYSVKPSKKVTKLVLSAGPEIGFAQNNPEHFETATPQFILWNASITSDLLLGKQKVLLTLQGSNLLNAVYQNHLSTLKELGYYNMGRNVSMHVKIPFGK